MEEVAAAWPQCRTPVIPLPKRQNLVENVVDALRQQIQQGRWVGLLPGERSLCHDLQVSRPTLRLAMDVLQREGWLENSQGRRRRILKPADPNSAGTEVVAMLSPVSLDALPQFVLFWVDELRAHLAKSGVSLEFHCSSAGAMQQPDRMLSALLLSTPSVQKWFDRNHIPCLVTGSALEETSLPSIDVDYRAACRHAVGVFRSRGHERVGLVVPASGYGGDSESEIGFAEGCAGGPDPIVIRHDGSREGVLRRLDASLRQRHGPTAFLAARAGASLTVLGALMRRGCEIPGRYAVISRDDEPFLDYMTPVIARYRTDRSLYARRLLRTVSQLLQSGHVPGRSIRLIPKLVTGETV